MSGETERAGIVTAGTWCADHNRLVDCWPSEDHIAEILSEEWQGGGSACNLAVDIKRLDPSIHVETIGLVGEDEDGRRLLAEADANGILRAQLRTTPQTATNYTYAFSSRRSGRRTHIFYGGASELLTPDHFDFAQTSAKLLHLGLPGIHKRMDLPWDDDVNGWVTVLKRARSHGLLTNMELASIGPERLAAIVGPCLEHLDYLIVNDVEIGALAGMQTSSGGQPSIESCKDAIRIVMKSGAMRLAIVHFPGGALALERGGEPFAIPSVHVPAEQIIGANGAGDAFAAGAVYGLLLGWPTADSIRLAHAAAAASLRSMTTTGTVEPWRDCLKLADSWGWRASL